MRWRNRIVKRISTESEEHRHSKYREMPSVKIYLLYENYRRIKPSEMSLSGFKEKSTHLC